MHGALWRDVVNFLEERPASPDEYLPLVEFILDGWSGGYFDSVAKHLRDPRCRDEIEQSVRLARIGFTIWRDRRDGLRTWAGQREEGPLTEEELEGWWFSDSRGPLAVDEMERVDEFLRDVALDPAGLAGLDAWIDGAPSRKAQRHELLVFRLHEHLQWTHELETLRALARKTWPADRQDRIPWTQAEYRLVSSYYADQQPDLEASSGNGPGIDPFALRAVLTEQELGFGAPELHYPMYIIMRAAMIDFMEGILDHARFPQARGSLQCIECGVFVGRHALGYGQLYCDVVCKRRAAKRRYRLARCARAESAVSVFSGPGHG